MAGASRHPGWGLTALFVAIAVPLGVWASARRAAVREHDDQIAREVPQETRPGYATSDRCEACHPSQYESWKRGYHHTMTQYASPAAVKGNFDNVQLDAGGYDVKLTRDGDDVYAEMVDPLWQYEVDFGQRDVRPGELAPRVRRRISLVTGSHHMQAYWVSTEVGNGQMSLPFTYLFDDQRWVPRGEVFLHPPEGGRHQLQVWNVACIRCHSTAGQPLALVGGKAIQTRVAEIGIACEQCHGPAEAHIAANQNPVRRYLQHIGGGGDPTIVNPARLDAKRGSQVCGQCHSITEVSEQIELGEGKTFIPGQDLEDSMPLLRPLRVTPALTKHVNEDPLWLKGYFWADGTIRVSSRDYSGMIESKCMQSEKLACMTCHSLHEADPNMLVKGAAQGDGACVGCHPKIGAALEQHTHHKAESAGSRCYNCHMPRTVYGLLKAIRNHRIDSPVVTGKSGGDERPNACNLCHVDQTLAWTARALNERYGQPIAPGLDANAAPAAVEWLLSGDAVLRALAAWHLGEHGDTNAVPYLVAAMQDPYSAVRYVAIHALQKLDKDAKADYLADDEARQQAGNEILQRWSAQHPELAKDIPAIGARVQALVKKRDDTPVRALE